MVTPHAVTAITTAELHAARTWLSQPWACAPGDPEAIAELPPTAVYRALTRRYDGGWPQFQYDNHTIRRRPIVHPAGSTGARQDRPPLTGARS